MKVKGSIFINLIKVIKSDKSGIFDKYLTAQDRGIINQKIYASFWYPYETYKNCLNAIYDVYGKKNPSAAKEWGRTGCKQAMTNMYSAFISDGDPMSFINSYGMIHKNFYDFGELEVIEEGKNQAVLKFTGLDAQCVPIFYMLQGWLEEGIALCGAQNIKGVFLTKSWEGHPETSMRFTWV
ncbi:MAG: hypothetical protein JW943_02045 [Deltaproteobacteria bacterium]|nr:hypothetical protein [Deltaproteobacteria bacterium]